MPKGKGYGYGSNKMGSKSESMGMKGYNHGIKKELMGHDSKPYHVNAFAAQKRNMNRINQLPMSYRGTPDQAFDYKY